MRPFLPRQSRSALRRIKSYLRNTVAGENLNAVAILNIERPAINCIQIVYLDEINDKLIVPNEGQKSLLLHNH